LGALALVLTTAACTVAERLAEVGRAPQLERPANPVERPGWRPVTLPMPEPEPQVAAGANSLWRSGARGFFRDQRARRVGDVLTVNVTINDKAELSNTSRRSRTNSDSLGLANLFGLENKLDKILPTPIDPSSLVDANSSMQNRGLGATEREETIRLNVAAVVTQVLPNGNLVVEGRQEVRVNFEVREVIVAGVVRPEEAPIRKPRGRESAAAVHPGASPNCLLLQSVLLSQIGIIRPADVEFHTPSPGCVITARALVYSSGGCPMATLSVE
jgi:flagellar L-ring protein precursor FlgH